MRERQYHSAGVVIREVAGSLRRCTPGSRVMPRERKLGAVRARAFAKWAFDERAPTRRLLVHPSRLPLRKTVAYLAGGL
jgi:hypothetical protein